MDDHLPDPPRRHVVFTMHAFNVGGVATLYAALARAACRDGFRCTVLAADGPARESLDWGRANLAVRALDDPGTLEHAERLAHDAWLTVTAVSPDTTPLLVALMAARHTVVAIHGSAAVMEAWLGPARLAVVIAVLRGRPAINVMVPGTNFIDHLHSLLGIPATRFTWLPHSTECPDDMPSPTGAPRATHVLCPTRLSEEKRFLIRASADLAAARGRRLVVVGVGLDLAWVGQYLADRGDVEFSVIQDPSLGPWMREADVVVGTGLVAMEAMVQGCAVVVPSEVGSGTFTDVVTPRNWASLHTQNFLGLGGAVMPVDEVWRSLDALSPDDRRAVVECVRRDASPDVAWQAVRAAGTPTPSTEEDQSPLISAMARAWVEAEHQLSELRSWLDEVTQARDYFRSQTEAITAAAHWHEQQAHNWQEAYTAMAAEAAALREDLAAQAARLARFERKLAPLLRTWRAVRRVFCLGG